MRLIVPVLLLLSGCFGTAVGQETSGVDATTGDTDGGTGMGTTGASTTGAPSTTGPSTDAGSSGGSGGGDTDPAGTGTGNGPTGTSSATGSTTGDCPPGTEGCPCRRDMTCNADLLCEDGVCVPGPVCDTIDVTPHGDEASAVLLDPLLCTESMDLGIIATIDGPENDWYTFFGDDEQFCPEQPTATATSPATLEVCVYISCLSGGDVSLLQCEFPAVMASSPDGRPGCCAPTSATISAYDCDGFGGKDVNVFVSVGSERAECVDYGLEYSF